MVFATPQQPLTTMGTVKYNYTGPEKLSQTEKDNIAKWYNNSFRGDLVNAGVPIVVSGNTLDEVNRVRAENNQMNQDQGGRFQSTDAQGNKFWGYKKYENEIQQASYRIDTTINVWKIPGSDDKYDMNFYVNVVDNTTGEVIDHTTIWERNTKQYINEKIVGPEPTWVETYLTGYAKEVTYEDVLRNMMAETAKSVTSKLATLSGGEIRSDAENFLNAMEEITTQNNIEQQVENSNPASPAITQPLKCNGKDPSGDQYPPGTSIAQSDDQNVLGKDFCPNFMILEGSGIYCFCSTEETLDFFETNNGQNYNIPPTYPFIGAKPWEPPTKSSSDEALDDNESETYSDSSDVNNPPSENYSPPSGPWTVPR